MQKILKICTFFGLLFVASSFAQNQDCQNHFLNAETAAAKLNTWIASDDIAGTKVILERYLELTKNASLLQLLPHGVMLEIITDPEMPIYTKVLREVFEEMKLNTPLSDAQVKDPHLATLFEKSLRSVLEKKVPLNTIDQRIEGLKQLNIENVRRALADLTLEEVNLLLHGGDSLHPTPESLLGKYIAETGAVTTVRGFTKDPNQYTSPNVGPKRLIVPVSAKSFETFSKYFNREEFFAIYGHAYVFQNGKLNDFAHRNIDFRMPGVGVPLPTVVLKTTEGQRLTQFWRFNVEEISSGKHRAANPWLIKGYCAQGGYGNCTHYIANIPIGDKLVDEYAFPANYDYGGNADKAPKVQKLQPYDSPDILVKRVWKVPGHEQLADAIGLRDENLQANMAGPGYLIHTILSAPQVDRLPLVFLIVDDHTKAIPENFAYTIEVAQ